MSATWDAVFYIASVRGGSFRMPFNDKTSKQTNACLADTASDEAEQAQSCVDAGLSFWAKNVNGQQVMSPINVLDQGHLLQREEGGGAKNSAIPKEAYVELTRRGVISVT